jgi:hypothetical protein
MLGFRSLGDMFRFRSVGIDWVVGRVLDSKSLRMCWIANLLNMLDSVSLSVCCIVDP